MKPPVIVTETGKVAASMLAGWGLDWADTIAAIEDEARESVADGMVPALRNLIIWARMVAQWTDNITEWTVPPPLNEELRGLQKALVKFEKAGGKEPDDLTRVTT